MATSNIDCNLSDGMFPYVQLHNLNIFNPSIMTECHEEDPEFPVQPTTLVVNNSNSSDAQVVKDIASQILSECSQLPIVDNNDNCTFSTTGQSSSQDFDINKHPVTTRKFNRNVSFDLNVRNVMPEELFINVDSDDEGVHSWRPHMSSDVLCPDFFVSSQLFQSDLNLPVTSPCQSDVNKMSNWTAETTNSQLSAEHSPQSSHRSSLKLDFEGHIHSQVAGLNIVRYEVINAQRKVSELKEEIQKLNNKLSEKLIVQRTLDMGKLRKENAELRLECQCLCMEVDYYLKGQAPLGEIDEEFYSKKPQDEETATPMSGTEEQKWDCHKCTFANHPDINSCEMCHTLRHGSPSPYLAAESSCYCHPSS